MSPDLRRNPLNGELVLVAPGRALRPGAIGRTTRVDEAANCPFCEGHEQETPPELAVEAAAGREPDGPGWTVRVVPNKYPAIPGHEVVVHGPSHLTAFADVSPRLAEEVVTMWGRRRCAHAGAGRAYLLAGMNEGPAAGASLPHSHSQLVPFDHVPPAVTAEAAAMEPGCALCGALAVVDAPVRDADGLLTFCPPWGRSPYETWIVPRDHEPAIADPGAAGRALLDLARRFRSVLGEGLSWNVIVHDAPLAGGSWHWHAEVLPRITVPALIELGAGIWISTADPDRAGEELAAAAV